MLAWGFWASISYLPVVVISLVVEVLIKVRVAVVVDVHLQLQSSVK